MESQFLTYALVAVGGFGVLNTLFSGATLFKLIDFAQDYGAHKARTLKNEEEIGKLKDQQLDLSNRIAYIQGVHSASSSHDGNNQ